MKYVPSQNAIERRLDKSRFKSTLNYYHAELDAAVKKISALEDRVRHCEEEAKNLIDKMQAIADIDLEVEAEILIKKGV